MDALKLLKQDHRDVEALFKQFEKAGDGALARKEEICRQVIRLLAIHSNIEEQVLYPAAREVSEELESKTLEALEEHLVAKWTLAALEKMKADDERFEAKMKVLMDSIRHHVEEEEGELFPELSKLMGKEQLEALGAAMAQAKKLVPTHPHPRAPDEPPGNLVAGPMAKVLDTGRDLATAVKRRLNPARMTRRTAGAH
jgi:hemerythrin superfamily protein